MEIYEILKQEHQEVSSLLQQLEEAEHGSGRRLLEQLREKVMTHTQMEETLFYSLLKNAEETQDLIQDSLREHQQVADALLEMQVMAEQSDDWIAELARLKNNLLGHIHEEENKLFRRAHKVISSERATQLAERWMELKRLTVRGSAGDLEHPVLP